MNALKTFFLTTTLLIATSSFAQVASETDASATSARWTCDAHGFQGTGGPGGGFWQTVRGYGRTQYDAASDALSRCHSFSLRQCQLGGCFRIRR